MPYLQLTYIYQRILRNDTEILKNSNTMKGYYQKTHAKYNKRNPGGHQQELGSIKVYYADKTEAIP